MSATNPSLSKIQDLLWQVASEPAASKAHVEILRLVVRLAEGADAIPEGDRDRASQLGDAVAALISRSPEDFLAARAELERDVAGLRVPIDGLQQAIDEIRDLPRTVELQRDVAPPPDFATTIPAVMARVRAGEASLGERIARFLAEARAEIARLAAASPLHAQVAYASTGSRKLTASNGWVMEMRSTPSGTLVVLDGEGVPEDPVTMAWLDRKGAPHHAELAPGDYHEAVVDSSILDAPAVGLLRDEELLWMRLVQ